MKVNTLKNKLFLFGIAVFFITAVYYSVQMKDYIAYVDEPANVTAIYNLMNEGRPRAGAYMDTVNYVPQPVERVMWEYGLETVLRIPMYLLGKYLGVNSLQYITNILFGMLSIGSIAFYMKRKETADSYKDAAGYLFILLALSTGLMRLFHYTRYFSLAMVCFLMAVIMIPLLYHAGNIKKKELLILSLAVLPIFFHMFYVIFFSVIFLFMAVHIYKSRKTVNFNIKFKKNKIIELVFYGAIIGSVLIMSTVIAYRVVFLKGIKLFEIRNLNYFLTNTIGRNAWQFVVLLAIITALCLQYKKYSSEMKTLTWLNAGYLLTGMACSVLIGSSMWRVSRYYISFKISYLCLIAIVLAGFSININLKRAAVLVLSGLLIYTGGGTCRKESMPVCR